jgi:hypothetical protein
MRPHALLFAPLFLALAQPAAALSCAPADMFLSLENAAASPEADFVFVGSLTKLAVPELPNGDQPMRLTGIELTGNGAPVDMEAMGRVSCVDTWCGTVEDTAQGVFFGTIDSDVGPLVFTFPACGGTVFPNPDPEAVADLGDTLQQMQRAALDNMDGEDAAQDGAGPVASAQEVDQTGGGSADVPDQPLLDTGPVASSPALDAPAP